MGKQYETSVFEVPQFVGVFARTLPQARFPAMPKISVAEHTESVEVLAVRLTYVGMSNHSHVAE